MPGITSANGSRQPMFLVVMSIFLFVSVTTVSLRVYCRLHYIKAIGLDDYFAVAALCVAMALGFMNGFHVSWGTGLHVGDLPLDPEAALIPTLKFWYSYQLIYPLALLFVKMSLLSLYWRLFSQRAFRLFTYTVAGVVTSYTIIVIFVNAFECPHKVSDAWAVTFPQGCNNLPASYFSMASINITTDLVILIMPLPVLNKLNINSNRRWALMGIFLVGSVAVIASIVRLYSLYVYTVTQDVSYDAIFILLWSQIEINVAITCASIPALRPLFKRTFGSSGGYASGYNNGVYANNQSGGNVYANRLQRTRNNGAMELSSLSGHGREAKTTITARRDGQTDNDSEELILGKDGITRTTETKVTAEDGLNFDFGLDRDRDRNSRCWKANEA